MKKRMFKSKEEVDAYLSGNKIQCLICGKPLKTMFAHLYWKHNRMTITQYKQRFGLPMSRGVIAKQTKIKIRNNLNQMKVDGIINTTIPPDVMSKAQQAPKRMYVPYHIENLKKKGFVQAQKRKTESLDRIRSINWDKFLKNLATTKDSMETIRKKDKSTPSYYDIMRNKKIDKTFTEKYEKAMKQKLCKK